MDATKALLAFIAGFGAAVLVRKYRDDLTKLQATKRRHLARQMVADRAGDDGDDHADPEVVLPRWAKSDKFAQPPAQAE